ncbi:MAG: hypothetical protein U5L11_06975 [Arhodomonas sp.]|nr:hypothetical protein [Arhodomonas sp.]
MNPGKIVSPDGDTDTIWRVDGVTLRGEFDRQVDPGVRERWGKAFDCNGNGACFDWDVAQVICPSYKATRDRVHSPRGVPCSCGSGYAVTGSPPRNGRPWRR